MRLYKSYKSLGCPFFKRLMYSKTPCSLNWLHGVFVFAVDNIKMLRYKLKTNINIYQWARYGK